MYRKSALVACAAVAGMILAAGPAVSAPPPSGPQQLADHLITPLHLAIGKGKTVLVSQEFAGIISRINKDGSVATVYDSHGWDVGGLESRGSTLFFVESQGAGPFDPRPLAGNLKAIDGLAPGKDGSAPRQIADLAAVETSTNPDGSVHYGFGPDVPADCLAQLPPMIPGSYVGEVDSHPYAVAVSGHKVYIADAGSNSILKVNESTGAISTLAVLPPQPVTVTAQAVAGMGLPECLVGRSYAFEPVPTDVEIGPDGWLYVTTLPGGPEDDSLGARGSVYRVNPVTGKSTLWAGGIVSATGLAVAPNGDVYVASLFGPGVIRVDAETRAKSVFLPAALAADVEISGSTLYATVDALASDPSAPPDPTVPPAGKVVSVPLAGGHDDDGEHDDGES